MSDKSLYIHLFWKWTPPPPPAPFVCCITPSCPCTNLSKFGGKQSRLLQNRKWHNGIRGVLWCRIHLPFSWHKNQTYVQPLWKSVLKIDSVYIWNNVKTPKIRIFQPSDGYKTKDHGLLQRSHPSVPPVTPHITENLNLSVPTENAAFPHAKDHRKLSWRRALPDPSNKTKNPEGSREPDYKQVCLCKNDLQTPWQL